MELESLRRSVRRLQLAIAACGIAIGALGGAVVIASQPADELAIGHVTIHEHGITITSPVANDRVQLQADRVQVSSDRGGVLVKPDEYVMNDRYARHAIRMQTWDGAAKLEVSSSESREYMFQPRTDFTVLSTRDEVIARTTAAAGSQELRANR
jgi:hypothetical protein